MSVFYYFFFNDTATTEIYTLSLHDALPIYDGAQLGGLHVFFGRGLVCREHDVFAHDAAALAHHQRSEEHTSELQSRQYLVCRLLLEKKTTTITYVFIFSSQIDTLTLMHAST